MRNILLTTCNAKYIHKNLALRWIYASCPYQEKVILKEYTIKDSASSIASDILHKHVDIVCFSCYIWNIELTKEIIQLLKENRPSIHIIVGGPEVSYESFELIQQGVDAISIGEGEESIWEYITMFEHQQHHVVKGIYTQSYPDRTYRKTSLSYLETLKDPYFMDMDASDMGKRYLYLETSRGCPYSCSYCLSSTDRQVRMFSLDYVLQLLAKIAESDVKQVKLLDRTFNADPQRALSIARYMNEHCTHQIFQFEIVAETLSEELLDFFVHEADKERFRFEIGVQSFHQKTLASVGRIQNNQRLCEVIRKLRDAGCTMHVDLIAGLPYEGFQSFRSSFDQLFALHASELQLGILKLLKGTTLRNEQNLYGFNFHVEAPYDVVSTNWLTKEELQRIHEGADAVEKFWNHGVCRNVIKVILEEGWYESPFDLFLDLGREYQKLTRPYQPYDLFRCFYPLLTSVDNYIVDGLLLSAYYPRFKQKPHRFSEGRLSLEKKKEIMWFAEECGIAEQNKLFRYGVVDIAYVNHTCGYQLVLYNKEQRLPKQWFIDKELHEIKEMVQ